MSEERRHKLIIDGHDVELIRVGKIHWQANVWIGDVVTMMCGGMYSKEDAIKAAEYEIKQVTQHSV